jgi:hypothetical protein
VVHIIYKLIDPRDQLPHYVGCTSHQPRLRLQAHLYDETTNPRRVAWIRELQALGLQPIIVEIERVGTEEEALKRERWWIRHLLDQGMPLLNIIGVPVEPLQKTTFYLTYGQLEKLDDLRLAHRKRTGRRINRNDIVRYLIDQCTDEDLQNL